MKDFLGLTKTIIEIVLRGSGFLFAVVLSFSVHILLFLLEHLKVKLDEAINYVVDCNPPHEDDGSVREEYVKSLNRCYYSSPEEDSFVVDPNGITIRPISRAVMINMGDSISVLDHKEVDELLYILKEAKKNSLLENIVLDPETIDLLSSYNRAILIDSEL